MREPMHTYDMAYADFVKGLLVLRPETVKRVEGSGVAEQHPGADVHPFYEVARNAHPDDGGPPPQTFR